MPTVLRVDGYRFFFFSNEGTEPPHVHVEKGDATGKWWLNPIQVAGTAGFKPPQIKKIHTLLLQNRAFLLERWNERQKRTR
jgi:hypothetical protein